jgi:iduronate 2-sulfatase
LVEWKLPGQGPEEAVYELYDYEADPGENKNLADEKPEVVKELKAILAKQPEAKPQVKATPASAAKGPKAEGAEA